MVQDCRLAALSLGRRRGSRHPNHPGPARRAFGSGDYAPGQADGHSQRAVPLVRHRFVRPREPPPARPGTRLDRAALWL